jgi:beta-glucanase (GH16 family)
MQALVAALTLASASAASFCDSPGWKSVYTDEFTSPTLDTNSWSVDTSGGDSRVRDSLGTVDNVYVEDGKLVLRSMKENVGGYNYTSGSVQSQDLKYWEGPTRVCVSAKLPGGGGQNGVWPAIWMMPNTDACWPSNGEIDIMEMVNGDGTLHGTYHWQKEGNCGDEPIPHPSTGSITMDGGFADDYHEYAVEYSADGIAWALDGVVFKTIVAGETVSNGGTSGMPVEMFDVPYYIILNTALGGPWPEPVDDSAIFPMYHMIDYVRVSQRE